jgi:hypothetical protein
MTEEVSTDRLASLPRVTALPSAPGASSRSAMDFAAALCRGALLGGIAITLGWALTETIGSARSSTLFGVATYVATLGAVYGLITTAWSDLLDRLWGRALERGAVGTWVGLLAGAVSGSAAFLLYSWLQEDTADPSGLRFYLLRMLAWAIFGAGIGAAPGLAERAPRKVVNGVLGGVIGGAIGGAVQHWASFEVASGSDARLLGLVAIGVGIGAATAVVELARRQAWLRVIAGGMAGKEFILYHRETDIGSSPKAQITLVKDQYAAPLHARIVDANRVRTVHAVEAEITVNGQVTDERRLRDGDLLQIGSTTLEYAEVDVDG